MFRTVKAQIIASFTVVLVIITVVAVLIVFQIIRLSEHELTDEMGFASAETCAAVLEMTKAEEGDFKPGTKTYEDYRETLQTLCRANHMNYMYACSFDVETQTATYLICVAADEKEDERLALRDLYGKAVQTPISSEHIAALAGQEVMHGVEYDNRFGHTIDWFSLIDGWDGKTLAAASYSVTKQRARVVSSALLCMVPFAIAVLALIVVELLILRIRIFKPLRSIAESMRSFSAKSANSFKPLNIKSRDELGDIAEAFNDMATDIGNYLNDIERLTTERVQANVQLKIARRIQLGMVPERTELSGNGFALCAFARTAREVGGDFYDCMTLEDGRVAAVIGDASGKGVGAALFMAMAKTLIHEGLTVNANPAEVLNQVNEKLCRFNSEGMFVTVFVFVFDPTTGELRFANAGHMPPFTIGDQACAVEVDPGVLLGLFDDAGLTEGIIHLAPGESFLLYTDGATEAISPDKTFFGEERFIHTLESHTPYEHPGELVDKATQMVDDFSDGQEQFDDLTFVALMRTDSAVTRDESAAGDESTSTEGANATGEGACAPIGEDGATSDRASAGDEDNSALTEVPVTMKSFSSVREAILAFDTPTRLKACLACEEAFANIVSYSDADHLWFNVAQKEDLICVTLVDDGTPFDPTQAPIADKQFHELDSGGMGMGLVRELTSSLKYEWRDGRNVLVFSV